MEIWYLQIYLKKSWTNCKNESSLDKGTKKYNQ